MCRGPILLCVDTSGSMRGARETVAKALALECMRAAKAQVGTAIVTCEARKPHWFTGLLPKFTFCSFRLQNANVTIAFWISVPRCWSRPVASAAGTLYHLHPTDTKLQSFCSIPHGMHTVALSHQHTNLSAWQDASLSMSVCASVTCTAATLTMSVEMAPAVYLI